MGGDSVSSRRAARPDALTSRRPPFEMQQTLELLARGWAELLLTSSGNSNNEAATFRCCCYGCWSDERLRWTFIWFGTGAKHPSCHHGRRWRRPNEIIWVSWKLAANPDQYRCHCQSWRKVPQYLVDARSRRRTSSEYGDYGHIAISRTVKQIADGGTKVNLGSNGELQGLGAHWEMWMLAQGGMQPFDVIRAATINGATYLGLDKEIGSLEVGKLADLVVMNDNPLDDIRNSEHIKYVMVNGRLYDTDSMNEIGNREKPRLHFYWQMSKSGMISLSDGN